MEYKYDVAISFAEEDRNAALALALALEMEGVKNVYYYPLHYEETWGQQLKDKLTCLYSEQARYAVLLLSPWYFKKDMTAVELNAVRSRASKEKHIAYMLPVILDEECLKEAQEFTELGYVKWEYNPRTIASTLHKLLGGEKADLPVYKATPIIIKSIVDSDLDSKGDISITITGETDPRATIAKSVINSTIKSGNDLTINLS